ncbi:MAG TPA: hypothetical protein VHB77_10625 [Planctomycetaceae bacterium]|nr:hypothetical protein [Planctomycetaceae bacterium]
MEVLNLSADNPVDRIFQAHLAAQLRSYQRNVTHAQEIIQKGWVPEPDAPGSSAMSRLPIEDPQTASLADASGYYFGIVDADAATPTAIAGQGFRGPSK